MQEQPSSVHPAVPQVSQGSQIASQGESSAAPSDAGSAGQLMRERVNGYVYARQQAADFVRSAGHPELAGSIILNWAPGFLPSECQDCGGSGDREVFVQSGGSMPWNAGDGHNESVKCPACNGDGLDYTRLLCPDCGEDHGDKAHGSDSVSPANEGARRDGQDSPLGLVERLRNGGQPDLADMAEGLVEALRYYTDAKCAGDTCGGGYYALEDDGRVAREALAKATGGAA